MPTPPAPHPSTGRGLAHGTCGELAQGVLPGGQRFHVTCPIDQQTAVEVTVRPAAATVVRGVGSDQAKIGRALELAAELLALEPAEIHVRRDTTLATAKGMASSTADIVAASRALAAATGTELAPQALASLAASIEATDGVMYDGICAVDQDSGAVVRRWDWWPDFVIAMAVPRAKLETSAVRFDGQSELAADYEQLLATLDTAADARDVAAFAAMASRSARMNQRFVRNPLLPVLDERAASLGALGACVAHTGTVAGLLFPATEDGRADATRAVRTLHRDLGPGVLVHVVATPSWEPAAAAMA